MRTPVEVVVVTDDALQLERVKLALGDLADAGGAGKIELTEGPPAVQVTLAEEQPAP
jgi:hypothetical protein